MCMYMCVCVCDCACMCMYVCDCVRLCDGVCDHVSVRICASVRGFNYKQTKYKLYMYLWPLRLLII